MDRNIILALLRHLLTWGGGMLVSYGVATEGQAADLIGGAISIVGVVLSIHDKRQRGAAPAAAPPAAPLLLLLLLPLAACAEQPVTAALTPANVECAAEVARAVVAHASADGATNAQKAVGSATALLSPACVAAAAAAVARE